MRDAAAAWWTWLAPLCVQTAIFAAAVLVIDRVLDRSGSARLRLALWLLVAARFLVPPTLTSPVGVAPWSDADAGAFDATPLFAAWLLGAAVVAGLCVLRAARLSRSVRGAAFDDPLVARAAARVGLRTAPRVVVSPAAATAFVHGCLRPVVVLPTDAGDDVEAMLLHEFAHVKRGDLVVDAALAALCVVFWFHPAAHLARRRVAHVREIRCDETVAAALGARAGEYRAALARAAARLLDGPRPSPAFLGGSSQIVARLRALDRGPARRPRLQTALAVAAGLALGAAALPSSRPFDADDARRLLDSAAAGDASPGCLRLHCAAIRIAAESGGR